MFGVAATEAAYNFCEDWLIQLLEYLEGNIAFLERYLLENIPGTRVLQPQGTYLLWLDFRSCGIAKDKLANFIREDAKVALEPGTLFGCQEEGFERMNIACPRVLLERGLSQITGAVNRLKQG
jgi:cysteine-S-conjugate beta-lyase